MGVAAVRKRPTRTGATVCVGAAALALGVMVGAGTATTAIGGELVGLLVAGLGAGAAARGARRVGLVVLGVGAAVALVAIPLALALAAATSVQIALLPGLVGLFLLAMAVLPVRDRGSRGLVMLGSGLVLVGVLAAALFRLAPGSRLLVASVLVVVAWDAGDHAIAVGGQLGTRADTRRLELVHLAGTVAVGAVAVAVATLVGGLSAGAVPLGGFVLLVVAAGLLTLALHG